MDYLEKISLDIPYFKGNIIKDPKKIFGTFSEKNSELVPFIIIMKKDFYEIINEFNPSDIFSPNCLFSFYKLENNEACKD